MIARLQRLAPLLSLCLAPAVAGQEPAFVFAGVHLRTELAEIAARYPASRRVGDYLYVAPQDSHDHIYGIELSGRGPVRRLRVTFERPPDAPSPDRSGRYPRCETVERVLERAYGPPAAVDRFAEEASRRADRLWWRGGEELRLICFAEPGRTGPFFAEAVQITPRAGGAADELVGRRVRVRAPALGPEWREGMFNRTRAEPPCYVVLLFKPRASPTAAIELVQTVAIADVTRLQLFAGARGAMSDWAGMTSSNAAEADWRDVDTAPLRSATQPPRC